MTETTPIKAVTTESRDYIYRQLVAELGDPYDENPGTVEIPVQSYRKHKNKP